MPRVRPFPAVRYDPARVDLERVLAPPYDVISPEQRERLAADEHNVVHLELPLDEEGEGSRYRVAARRLQDWLSGGVLRRDERARFYVYRQGFTHRGRRYERTALLGLVRLEPHGPEAGLHPHESTLRGPREDRLRLLRATGAALSPIFLLHDDAAGAVREALAAATRERPLGEAETPWGIRERLWALPERSAPEIERRLSQAALVFADGHHRYESALRHHRERGGDGEARHGYTLAAFAAIEDPGLLLLPTHRVLPEAPEPARASAAGIEGEAFEIVSLPASEDAAEAARVAERWLAERAAEGRTAWVARERGAPGLTGRVLREPWRERLFAAAGGGEPEALRGLDVAVLHAWLDAARGLDRAAVTERGALRYTHDAAEALGSVDRGAAAAFLVPPVPVRRVVELAVDGHRMPQKSTYFEPKLSSGWLLHVHAENAGTGSDPAAGEPHRVTP